MLVLVGLEKMVLALLQVLAGDFDVEEVELALALALVVGQVYKNDDNNKVNDSMDNYSKGKVVVLSHKDIENSLQMTLLFHKNT